MRRTLAARHHRRCRGKFHLADNFGCRRVVHARSATGPQHPHRRLALLELVHHVVRVRSQRVGRHEGQHGLHQFDRLDAGFLIEGRQGRTRLEHLASKAGIQVDELGRNVKAFGKGLGNRKIDAGLLRLDDRRRLQHFGIRGRCLDAVFVEQVFAVVQILRILLVGNGQHFAVRLDQHVVFDLVFDLVLGDQIGHRLKLAFGGQVGIDAVRNNRGIKRRLAVGTKRPFGLHARFGRDLDRHLERALVAGLHFLGQVLCRRHGAADDVDIAFARDVDTLGGDDAGHKRCDGSKRHQAATGEV